MAYQWKFLADITGPPGDGGLYGPAWAPWRNVPSDADMNTFKVPGVHRIATPDIQTILNLPQGMNSGAMLENVKTSPGSDASLDSWWTQRVTEIGTSPCTWWRSSSDTVGNWNPWRQASESSDTVTEVHVFLAVGQSNMSGRGDPSGGYRDPANPRILEYGAKVRTLRTASVPLDMHDSASGLSPATSFARAYLKTQPNHVGVLIIPAAHGGTGFTGSTTSLTWTPNVATDPTLDLPALAITQTEQAIAAAKAAGYTVSVEGALWHQGENNSSLSTSGYAAKLDDLIAYFRSELSLPKLPFIVGQMAPEGIDANAGRPGIDQAHQETPSRVPYTGFAKATRDGHNDGDTTHMSRIGVEFLGRTYAAALLGAGIAADSRTRLVSAEAAITAARTDAEVLDDKIDGIAPTWDAPGVSFAVVTEDGTPTWLQANDTTGGPTKEAEGAIRGAAGQALSDTPGASILFTTADGNPTWLQANDTDGGPTPEALTFLTQTAVTTAAEKTLPPERNFTISTYDGPRKLRSDQSLIVGYGDSHMQGGAVISTRWMSILGETFPAANVVNRGSGGNTTDLVAIRAGAIRPRLTFAGGSIPESGSVDVTFTDPIAYRNTGGFSVVGTVAGVVGTLARTDLYALTFTRTTAGTAVTTGPAEFVSNDYALYSGGVQIILAGRNDVSDDVALSDGSVPVSNSIDRAVSAHVAMVESQTPVIKKTLILGTLTDVGYVRGTVGYERVTGINTELQRIYPNYFWDLRGYLVNECIYDLGITPTSEDLSAMEQDTLPPSIMLEDNIHFGVEAHAMVAEQVAAQLISRKLVNP